MKSLPIERIRRRYRREWLLIAIQEMDEATTTPRRGRLLAHSPHRHDVYARSRRYPHPALIVYSENTFPKGYAAAFHGAYAASSPAARPPGSLRRSDRAADVAQPEAGR